MNYEKQCPSARNLAFLNHGVSPDRNALAKAAGARGNSTPKPTGCLLYTSPSPRDS